MDDLDGHHHQNAEAASAAPEISAQRQPERDLLEKAREWALWFEPAVDAVVAHLCGETAQPMGHVASADRDALGSVRVVSFAEVPRTGAPDSEDSSTQPGAADGGGTNGPLPMRTIGTDDALHGFTGLDGDLFVDTKLVEQALAAEGVLPGAGVLELGKLLLHELTHSKLRERVGNACDADPRGADSGCVTERFIFGFRPNFLALAKLVACSIQNPADDDSSTAQRVISRIKRTVADLTSLPEVPNTRSAVLRRIEIFVRLDIWRMSAFSLVARSKFVVEADGPPAALCAALTMPPVSALLSRHPATDHHESKARKGRRTRRAARSAPIDAAGAAKPGQDLPSTQSARPRVVTFADG